MGVLKGYMHNCNRFEGCVTKLYIAEESIEFCFEYLSGVDSIGKPINKFSWIMKC